MGVVCEQCLADDMVVNEQGYFQCDQCGYILHSVVPESAEMDDTPGGAPVGRQIVSAQVLRRQQLESAKSAADAAADMRAELMRPVLPTVDEGVDQSERDWNDFDALPDGVVDVPTLFHAMQLVLTWHVRALAPKIGIESGLLANVVGQMWLRYLESRDELIQYRRRRKLVVPVHLRKRLRRVARQVGDEEAAHRIAHMHGTDIQFDDVLDRVTGTDQRARALEVSNRPRIVIVLALLWLGALHLRVGLLPCDLVRWCYDGSLPFLVAVAKFAPTQLDRAYLKGARQAFSAFKIAHTALSLVRQLQLPRVCAQYAGDCRRGGAAPRAAARRAGDLRAPVCAFCCASGHVWPTDTIGEGWQVGRKADGDACRGAFGRRAPCALWRRVRRECRARTRVRLCID
jgi:hypothetical protein